MELNLLDPWVKDQVGKALRWGLLKLHLLISLWVFFSILQKFLLDSFNHINIWQLSLQLSCGNTCQIWKWYSIGKQYFDNDEKSGLQKNRKNLFSKPHLRGPFH